MLTEESRFAVRAHKLLDICLTAAAFIVSWYVKWFMLPKPLRGLTIVPNYYIILLVIIIIWYLYFELFGLYVSYRRRSFSRIFIDTLKAVSAGMLTMALVIYIFKIVDISRLLLGMFFILNIGLLAFSKWIIYRFLKSYWQKGFNIRNIIIVGSKTRAVDVITAVKDYYQSGFKIIGCLDINQEDIGREVKEDIRVIDTVDHLQKIILEQVVDEIIFAMPLKRISHIEDYILAAEKVGITVRIIPDWQISKVMYTPQIAKMRFEQFLGLITMTLSTTTAYRGALIVKNVFDYVFAGAALLLLLPLLLLIALAIRVSSPGPVLYRQRRCGLNGRIFMVLKFRTMVADAEERLAEIKDLNEADGPVFKVKDDPRIIPYVGTFLRKSSLDELPQLINILQGEMSLIGPRPPIPEEVEHYDPWQRRRISMKPGITCIWQTAPHRNDLGFEQWMQMDLEYIDNWSLWLDLKIFFRTVLVMLLGMGR